MLVSGRVRPYRVPSLEGYYDNCGSPCDRPSDICHPGSPSITCSSEGLDPRSPGTHMVGPWVTDNIKLYRDLRTGTQYLSNWASRASLGFRHVI